MKKLQLITGIHKVHHIRWSYGYVVKVLGIGYFGKYKFKKVEKSEYHNCTTTGIN